MQAAQEGLLKCRNIQLESRRHGKRKEKIKKKIQKSKENFEENFEVKNNFEHHKRICRQKRLCKIIQGSKAEIKKVQTEKPARKRGF